MSDKEHARLSPSSMERRLLCPGSLALEERTPNTTSRFAEEGTAAHELFEWAMKENAVFLSVYEGRKTKNGWTINEEMIENVQVVVDRVRDCGRRYEQLGATVTILAEERVDFSFEIGIEESFGTSDIIMIVEFPDGTAHIGIDDLKYGKGHQVGAKKNKQMMTYGLAVYSLYSLIYNITRIRMAIHQPRLDHHSEWEVPIEKILKFRDKLRPAAHLTIELADALKAGKTTIDKIDKQGHLQPGDEQCLFCRAKSYCPAITRKVLGAVDDEFEDLTQEVGAMTKTAEKAIARLDKGVIPLRKIEDYGLVLDLFEDWIKAVRGRLEAELFAGKELEEWKLVAGRKGHRAWVNAQKVEKALKKMRLRDTEMYERKLISPVTAEKIFAKENPRRWMKLQKLYRQSPGRPSIARKSDKRPAFVPLNVEDEFDDLTNESNFDDLA